MRLISIDVSPHQLRRLKKGHKIRLRKGTGFNLVVHPTTYNLMSRSFKKGKAMDVKLTNEELESNKAVAEEPEKMNEIAEATKAESGEMPSMEGQGIFSSLKKGVKKMAPVLKPLAKAGLTHLAPKVSEKLAGKPMLQKVANFGMEQAGKQLGKGMPRGCGMRGRAVRERSESPPVHGLTRKVGHEVAEANNALASMSKKSIDQRIKNQYPSYDELSEQPFAPFSRGYGMHSNQHAIVGRGGGMIGHGGFMPPALMSQPFSANYQMSHFLPPAYQHYNNAMHEGSGQGLYAGRGLYAGGHGLFA
tara:strand:+ start:415 stop:1326 length:912 start_codon:yes stop_codon:yes gene_type:complete